MSGDDDRTDVPLTKVAFVLDGGPSTVPGTVAEEPAGGAETLWAEVLGEGRYRLRNSPFAAYGISFHDVVAAELVNDQLTATRILSRGGHSTYRVYLSAGVTKQVFLDRWPMIGALGCNHENANSRFFAIDVRPEGDIRAIHAELERGEREGLWQFEAAHYGHDA
jgi:hypothetical protein